MGRIILAAVSILLFAMCMSAVDQSFEKIKASEDELKAAYMIKFPIFIEWQAEMEAARQSAPFVIGYIGEPFGVYTYLQEMVQNLLIKERKVELHLIRDLDEIGRCHMVFIDNKEEYRLKSILSRTENKPILTIGESEGAGQKGVLINYYLEGSFLHFEINTKAVKASGLIFSSIILRKARLI